MTSRSQPFRLLRRLVYATRQDSVMRRVASLRLVRYSRYVQPNGDKIRRQRELKGYGLRRFAEVAEIDHTHLSRIERGLRKPQPEVMKRIADTLGCLITDLEQDRTEAQP